MKFTIGKFDPESGTVPVTFEKDRKSHSRRVNAVCDAGGGYDRKATRERVEDVARGVEHKFALGLLGEGSEG